MSNEKFTPAPWFVKEYSMGHIEIQCDMAHSGADLFDRNRHDNALQNAYLAAAAPSMRAALTELIEIRQQRMISGDTRELMEKEAEAYNRAYIALEKAVPKVAYEIPSYPSDY